MMVTFVLQMIESFNPCGGLHPATCLGAGTVRMSDVNDDDCHGDHHHARCQWWWWSPYSKIIYDQFDHCNEDDSLAMKKTLIRKMTTITKMIMMIIPPAPDSLSSSIVVVLQVGRLCALWSPILQSCYYAAWQWQWWWWQWWWLFVHFVKVELWVRQPLLISNLRRFCLQFQPSCNIAQ